MKQIITTYRPDYPHPTEADVARITASYENDKRYEHCNIPLTNGKDYRSEVLHFEAANKLKNDLGLFGDLVLVGNTETSIGFIYNIVEDSPTFS